jgi:hypothetical protein
VIGKDTMVMRSISVVVPPPGTSFAALTKCHPPHKGEG